MKFKMTVVKDVVKSKGRQITVEITSDDKIAQGRLKQIAVPYQITETFGVNIPKINILKSLKHTVRTELKNYKFEKRSLVHSEVEINI